MQAFDGKILGERLSELSEVFQAKPVSEKGLSVWFNVLREFPTEKVCGVLLGWARSHNKMPSPNEVWKVVNETSIVERERKAAQERAEQPFSQVHPGVGGTQAEKFIAKMRETLNQPQWSPLEHWQRVLKTQKKGSIGYEYATKALIMKGVIEDPRKSREPGEDDESKAVNF